MESIGLLELSQIDQKMMNNNCILSSKRYYDIAFVSFEIVL